MDKDELRTKKTNLDNQLSSVKDTNKTLNRQIAALKSSMDILQKEQDEFYGYCDDLQRSIISDCDGYWYGNSYDNVKKKHDTLVEMAWKQKGKLDDAYAAMKKKKTDLESKVSTNTKLINNLESSLKTVNKQIKEF
ncbi:MAG: DUF5082 domain-containing protein [Lachnospiraceae bacterium]|nr:DUF5082 domain-containing protein [Lachnospiraceae bacterium]